MLNDFKLAWRNIRHTPAFTFVAVAIMALSVGTNTAIFGIADALLFRSLPYADPDRLFVLRALDRQTGADSSFVPPSYLQVIAEHHPGAITIGRRDTIVIAPHMGEQGAEWAPTTAVEPNYLNVLGVRPIKGRLFDGTDVADPGSCAILSYRTWRERFGGDDGIVGRSVTLGRRTRQIIGVLPRGFMFPARYQALPLVEPGRPQYDYVTVADPRARLNFDPVVRVGRGITRDQAQAQIGALVAPLRSLSVRDGGPDLILVDVRSVVFPTSRPLLRALAAAALLVLLIGCTNTGLMLLVRARRRERDISLRAALGAAPKRLIWPILFETVLIALAGALVALPLAAATFHALLRNVPRLVYGDATVGVDWRVAILSMALGGFSGIVLSAAPAWRAVRLSIRPFAEGWNRGTGGLRSRFPAVIITAQVALTLLLVLGAAMATRTLVSVFRLPLGFTARNVITVTVEPSVPDRRGFYMSAVQTLGDRRDVAAAGATSHLPLTGFGADEAIVVSGRRTRAYVLHVLPGYFESIGLHLVRGRLLTWDDARTGADVAVVAESAARMLFPSGDPVGRTFRTDSGRDLAVVGIVADVLGSFDAALNPPLAYVIPTDSPGRLTLVARMRHRDPRLGPQIRGEISRLDSAAAMSISWWAEGLGNVVEIQAPQLQTLVLGTFAALALGLTALGILGTVAFVTGTRRREVAVRIALGATRKSIVGLFLRETMIPVAVGIGLSVMAARWLGPLAQAHLFNVQAPGVVVLGAAIATVASAAALAAYLPARRASRLDPGTVLRVE
jgi:putative ABC transport system permease protein